ncbi:MAG: glycosyltransferase [Bacteroidales bacterium]|nr:glycosyltransferase [Bacteroidales bacterium]
MKILILSASHPYKTAGVIINDLNEELVKRGHESKLMVKAYDKYDNENIINYYSKFGFCYKRRIINKLKKIGLKIVQTSRFDVDFSVQTPNQARSLANVKRILKKICFTPDLIYVFFTQEFISFKDLYNLQKITGAPILYNIPDMSAFTGLCHYSWDCNNYEHDCGNCPAIYSTKYMDQSYKNLKSKLFYAHKLNIYGMGVSNWIVDRARKSSVFRDKSIFKIPSTTTRRNFSPINTEKKAFLRKKNSIDKNAFVIAFGAVALSSKRKGVIYIIEALNNMDKKFISDHKIQVIYSGKGNLPLSIDGVESTYFGMLDWDGLKEFYQISDLFISASLQDVGPGTILEAMLCGIPVVSFDVGVATEWVISGETGYLTKESTREELLKGLHLIIEKYKVDSNFFHGSCASFAKNKNNYSLFYDAIEGVMKSIMVKS